MPNILVVEDSPMTRTFYGLFLMDRGYEVTEAASAAEATALLRNDRPDLVVLDIKLPDVSGFEVLRFIRSDPVLSDVPVVVASACKHGAHLTKGYTEGCTIYLTKPFEMSDFVLCVDRLLEPRYACHAA